MPFIKLKTDLASLKFGQDKPGGGSSDQPFMQFPNNNQQISDALVGTSVFFTDQYSIVTPSSDTPKNFLDLYVANETSLDYPVRGGGLDFNVFTQTATKLALVDKQRIQKFLNSDPRGKLFLQKQIALQFTNPKIQTGDSISGLNEPRSPQLLENTRIFNNGINLLTQVGLSGTGTHIKRHGLFPINPLEKNYADIVIGQPYSENRLVLLSSLKLPASAARVRSASTLNSRALGAKLGISYNRNILFSYLGGPGSVYGIGATTIKRYEDTSTLSSPTAMSYQQILQKQPFAKGEERFSNGAYAGGYLKQALGDIVDYRKSIMSKGEPWGGKNGTGKLSDTLVYKFTVNGVDNLNKANLLLFNNSKAPWEVESNDPSFKKDIIKFVFEAIDNDYIDHSIAIFFRAFLTSFQDNHQAAINTFKYVGRAEDFFTYQGVSRGISFGFKIAVFSKEEMKPLYKKLNHLISQVYPDYSEGGIMRAPLMRITIGDYLYRIAGLLESINITVDGNTPWEIQEKEDDETVRQLPRVIDVNCSFRPIQDFLPRRAKANDLNVPFITDQSGDYVDGTLDFEKAQLTFNKPQINSSVIDNSQFDVNNIKEKLKLDLGQNVRGTAFDAVVQNENADAMSLGNQFQNSVRNAKVYSSNSDLINYKDNPPSLPDYAQ